MRIRKIILSIIIFAVFVVLPAVQANTVSNLDDEKQVEVWQNTNNGKRNILENKLQFEKFSSTPKLKSSIARSTDSVYTRPSGVSSITESVVYEDDSYDYYVTQLTTSSKQQFKIVKHNIKANTNETIFSSEKTCMKVATYTKKSTIYVAYIKDYVWGVDEYSKISVIKYNTSTGKVSTVGTFNTNYNDNDYYPSFAVDSKERFYFVSNYKDVNVFSNSGTLIYNYAPDIDSDLEIIINGISPNDKALFFSLTTSINTIYRYNEREGIQKLNNGKFVYEDGYTVFAHQLGQYYSKDPNWQFLDNSGTYAINQYGQIAKFDYNSSSIMGVSYTLNIDLMRYVLDYAYSSQSNVPYTVTDEYIYVAGDNNIIFAINPSNYEKEKRIDTGLGTDIDEYEIERITYSEGNIYIRYYNSNDGVRYLKVIENANEVAESFEDIVYSTHTSQTHTKSQITQKYNSTVSFDYSNSIYEEQPSSTSPYKAGALKEGVIEDTLNRLNFYRWLYCVEDVTLNTTKMERNQKGAVVLAATDELTHYPSQPSDMDDEFFKEAYDGCNAKADVGDTYSGNCAYGNVSLYNIIDGYIDDINNISMGTGAVGHRMSLLFPYATQTSFGQCDLYSTLSMYYDYTQTNNELPENFYAYPTAGYFPLEQFYTNEYWSLYVTENISLTKDFKLQFKYNGKNYDATGITTEASYPAIDFKMPDELIEELGGVWSRMPETTIEVLITGLNNSKGDNITYNYTVKFFSMEKVLKDFTLNKTSITLVEGESETLKITLNPRDAIIEENAKWTSSNELVAKVNSEGKITAIGKGEATITVTIEGISKTCKVTVIEPPPYTLGDVNLDGKINTKDARLVLLNYVGKEELNETQKLAADVNKDGKINTKDARQILLYYVGKISEFN